MSSPLDQIRALLHPEWSWVRQAIQTTVAAMVSYVVASVLGVPEVLWVVMTAVMVTQASVGAALGQALDRLVATILGASVGAVLAAVLPAHPSVQLAMAIFPLAYISAARPTLRLASVTAVIMILADQMLAGPVAAAVDRIGGIALGAAIAVGTAIVLFPSRAGSALAEQVAKTMPLFAEHLTDTIQSVLGKPLALDVFRERNAKIRAAARASETLAEASRAELAGHLSNHADPANILHAIRRLWQSLLSSARAARLPLPGALIDPLSPALSGFGAAGVGVMNDIEALYRGKAVTPDFTKLEQAQADLDAAVSALRGSGAFHGVPTEQTARLFTLLFALNQIAENLHDVADRYADMKAAGAGGTASSPAA